MARPRVFRDPVHGLIGFAAEDAALGGVLDTRAFQRLRRIRQDGFAWLVYPGAEHSRFGHALGAFHIAQRVTRRLDLAPQLARHVKGAALLPARGTTGWGPTTTSAGAGGSSPRTPSCAPRSRRSSRACPRRCARSGAR